MDPLITIIYLLFVICVVYPSQEFVSAGFTIPQLFDSYLGSENVNFIRYHMKRVTVTVLIHSCLPLGYTVALYVGGYQGGWLLPVAVGLATLPLCAIFMVFCWWERDMRRHPVVKVILPYVTEGSDWRVVAADINSEFRGVDKVTVPLTATSKLVATETWLLKVTSYGVRLVKQSDAALLATSTDSHDLTEMGDDEVQYITVEVIPSRPDIAQFTFRISTTALRELQPRLAQPVRMPAHISLLPTIVERFVGVFKQHIEMNPVYIMDEEPDLCIGCMVAPADVKISRQCLQPPPGYHSDSPPCQPCNCRVVWCSSCMARWWAARGPAPPEQWLGARCPCPVCRSTFCLLDVCPARMRETRTATTNDST